MSAIGRQKPTFPSSNPSQIQTDFGKDRVKGRTPRAQEKTSASFQEIAERKLRPRQMPPDNSKELENNATLLNVPFYSPWEKREGAVAAVSSQAAPPIVVSGGCYSASSVDRVLIGQSDLGAEARIRIASGMIAGTEVQIVAGKNGVEASVLAAPENSRRNVDYAMEEMAYRLRRKGYSVQITDNSPGRQEKPKQEGNEPDEQ